MYIEVLRIWWFVNHFNLLKILKCQIPAKIGQNVSPMSLIRSLAIDCQAALFQSPMRDKVADFLAEPVVVPIDELLQIVTRRHELITYKRSQLVDGKAGVRVTMLRNH